MSPHRLVIAITALCEAIAYRVAQQLECSDAVFDASALALRETPLLLRRSVAFADPITASGLNLAREKADVAFKRHQFGVMVLESSFEAMATQPAPLGLVDVRSRLPDGCKCGGFSL